MFDVLWKQFDFVIFAGGCVLLWSVASYWLTRASGHRLAIVLGWQFLALVLIPGWYMVEAAGDQESERLKRLLVGYAPIYAQEFERLGHARLRIDASPDDPLYLQLIDKQKRWLAVNTAIADIYTFRRLDDGSVVLVVDSETDYDHNDAYDNEREQRTAIGEVYEKVTPALLRSFDQGSVEIDGPVTDRWGTWLSASVPLRDAQGRIEAVLGIDYPAEEWLQAVTTARVSTLVMLGVLLTVLHGAICVVTLQNSNVARYRNVAEALRSSLAEIAESRANTETQATLLQIKNRQLLMARQLAEEATRAKSDFLANMSHEIRTPMTAILGFADMLLEEESALTKIGALQTIQRNGAHLLEIINDVLDLSKIEANKITLELCPCRANDVIQDVLALMRVRSKSKGLALTSELDTSFAYPLVTDPTRLRQILINLLGNAIKFTEHGSVKVVSRYSMVTESEVTLEITVVDTGPGMSSDVLSGLFSPFTQADSSTTRRFGGTGLGLTISQRFANMLGGQITVASKPGVGSEFTLCFTTSYLRREIPAEGARKSSTDSETPKAVPARLPANLNILLAEDGPDNQRLISHLLRKAGAEVSIVDNGQLALEAIEAARQTRPFDLVLMDMQMPVMDGYMATSALRERGETIPIIAITAHAMQGDRERCLAAGCDQYTTKPIQRAELLEIIMQVLANSRKSTAAGTPLPELATN